MPMLSQTLRARQQKFVCAFAPLRSGLWQQGSDFRYSVSSKNMTDVRTLRCPGCGEEIPLLPRGECQYSCPLCHSTITFSRRRLLASYILGFVLSLAVTKLLRLTATEAPLWILIFIPSFFCPMTSKPTCGRWLTAAGFGRFTSCLPATRFG